MKKYQNFKKHAFSTSKKQKLNAYLRRNEYQKVHFQKKDSSVETQQSAEKFQPQPYQLKSENKDYNQSLFAKDFNGLNKKIEFGDEDWETTTLKEQCYDFYLNGFCFDGNKCEKIHVSHHNKYQRIHKELFDSIEKQKDSNLDDLLKNVKIMKDQFDLGNDFMEVPKIMRMPMLN